MVWREPTFWIFLAAVVLVVLFTELKERRD
jgi:hypothetical protein